jgi:hypothetical protein
MTCQDCEAAAVRLHHSYIASCRGCTARAIGRQPPFFESQRFGFLTPQYQAQLQGLGVTHAEVKAARAADYEAHADRS